MKSVTYILVSLVFFSVTSAYSRYTTTSDSTKVYEPPHGIRDSVKVDRRSAFLDSTHIGMDSVRIVRHDTTTVDSVRIRFIPGMGQLRPEVDTANGLNQSHIVWSDAKHVGDILWKIPGFFLRELGEDGKYGQLNAFGLDGRNIGILLDGRPLNDPVNGTYNLSDIPLEFIDHVEVLSGSSSMTGPSDGIGTAVNFVSRSYNSYRPMTKLRFVQEPNGDILTDGIFTQNVARGLNLMIGFQRNVTQGRYTNAQLDAWNVRTRLRYNISDRLNIALTDFYTKAGNGLNGGITPGPLINIFDETTFPSFVNAWDSRSRRDMTLSTIARIFPDSSSLTHASVYYSTLDREYQNSSQNIDDLTKSRFWGIQLRQELGFDIVHLTLGGQWERRHSDSTRTLGSHLNSEQSLFLNTEVRLLHTFVPSVSFRTTSLDGKTTFSTGAGLKAIAADGLTLFVDASWFDRAPTLQEQYWKDSTVLRTGGMFSEQHAFFQAGLNIQAGSTFDISLSAFQRNVRRAITYQPATTAYGSPAIYISNVPEVRIRGAQGRVFLSWRGIEALGVMTVMQYRQSDTVKTLIPDIILTGEVSYRDRIFNEKLDAKVGVRSWFFNRQQGAQFDPQTLSYVEYTTSFIGRSTTFDLFVVLKIGDAHISLSWENLFNAGYLLAPIYPMPGRYIRLGVNWIFID